MEFSEIKWLSAVDTMGKEFEKSVKDSKGNVIKSSDRLRINSNGRLVFFIEPTKAMSESVKFLCGGKTEHNMYSVLVHVEDATGLLQEKGIILSYQ
ncbi:hypothetical protein FD25_GL000054 [Levilactobacillus acidifarinae DSM 19394]|uniref:Uncharacterized protein n=1 Tax=Levilactobacillus acidifarinae DSM 19394 = JCM 15949 TaxID=1423715 RepID=A0A0R1LVK8_9LACO|nr:hypothetical protein FD25_GL000054 [Levilactobacillus acidifarinae DSM 19394]